VTVHDCADCKLWRAVRSALTAHDARPIRLITGARRQEHLTPVLRQSHWLVPCPSTSVVQTGLVQVTIWSVYMADDVQLLADSGRRLLRSANYRTCVVPRTKNSFGDRDFSVAWPRRWNDLPPELRYPDISCGQFRNMLKSYLFGF